MENTLFPSPKPPDAGSGLRPAARKEAVPRSQLLPFFPSPSAKSSPKKTDTRSEHAGHRDYRKETLFPKRAVNSEQRALSPAGARRLRLIGLLLLMLLCVKIIAVAAVLQAAADVLKEGKAKGVSATHKARAKPGLVEPSPAAFAPPSITVL
ncbi:MAG TPA: hypothetical protein VJB16_02160 [archaeon]|nr:hypothetical protein [archaeon]